jgi:hypothetical protein
MEKAEREAIMRQGVTRAQTPRERRQLAGLEADLREAPQRGQHVRLRLRNFSPAADSYLAAARGPLAYMLRLHAIEVLTEEHEERLAEAWRSLADECGSDPRAFAARWRAIAGTWDFSGVNALVERHNRWYPVESGLPMNPATGDYVLINGRTYRMPPLGAGWVLERFPPALERVSLAA